VLIDTTTKEGTVMLPPVTLEGRYVRLEPLGLAHVPALTAIARGPRDTYGFTFVARDEPSMKAWVEAALADHAAGRALPFATVDRTSNRVVGSTRFGNVEFWAWPDGSPYRRAPGAPDVVEIGWTWLAADAQRTGVNTDAKLCMLTHAFEVWRVHRVSLMTDARNARSRAAILRLGAHHDGVLRGSRVAADGLIRDTAAYSILAEEWPGVKSGLVARLR
jgi:RimJ/RimL family protein N-acetyltransferase